MYTKQGKLPFQDMLSLFYTRMLYFLDIISLKIHTFCTIRIPIGL